MLRVPRQPDFNKLADYPTKVDEFLPAVDGILGSIEKIAEDLREWRERWGISYWVVQDEVADEMAPLVRVLSET